MSIHVAVDGQTIVASGGSTVKTFRIGNFENVLELKETRFDKPSESTNPCKVILYCFVTNIIDIANETIAVSRGSEPLIFFPYWNSIMIVDSKTRKQRPEIDLKSLFFSKLIFSLKVVSIISLYQMITNI